MGEETKLQPDELLALQAQILAEVAARQAAERELAELGINASPADIEWWLSYDPKQRRRANLAWAAIQASYL